MRTKPFKTASKHFSHSADFSEKEVYEVSLKPFKASNGRELVDLSISARSSFAGQTSVLVLDPTQLDDLEKAIKEYKDKKILPEAVIL